LSALAAGEEHACNLESCVIIKLGCAIVGSLALQGFGFNFQLTHAFSASPLLIKELVKKSRTK
jgi:hypothetical protein